MITYDKKTGMLRLQSRNTSLIYSVRAGEPVRQSYYGKTFKGDNPLTGSDEWYPAAGSGNRRKSALQALDLETGKAIGLRLSFDRIESTDDTVTIIQTDDPAGIEVRHTIRMVPELDIFQLSAVIRNTGSGRILVTGVTTGVCSLDWDDVSLRSFTGSWAQEMCQDEAVLSNGIHIVGESCGVRTTRFRNSSMIFSKGKDLIQESTGECLGLCYHWSGNWAVTADVDREGPVRILVGEHPETSHRTLGPGESWTSPMMSMTYSDAGAGPVSRRYHAWAREEGIRDGHDVRPIVLNSWEAAYFSFDEERLTSMIRDAASVGVELFVLDDGWFGNNHPRNDDLSGLGDWETNRKKLPRGLGYLADTCREEGIRFGLWMEPEMVNPNSDLYEAHPDWVITDNKREPLQERNQLILDLSKDEVTDWIISVFDRVLSEVPDLAYIKWDCNRNILDYSGDFDLYDRYSRNYYRILTHLKEQYPDLIIQNCASGGGRVDYGALSMTHEFWTSDNTDAIQRIFIQWGTGHFYPPAYSAAHVSAQKNHMTGRITPLKFRCDVAFSGRLGLEVALEDVTEEEKTYLAGVLDTYKEVRHLIREGDLYRLQSPYGSDYAAISYVSEDRDEALLFIWGMHYQMKKRYEPLALKGLDPDAVYTMRELNKIEIDLHMMNPTAVLDLDGKEICGDGDLPIMFSHEFDSRVYHLKRK